MWIFYFENIFVHFDCCQALATPKFTCGSLKMLRQYRERTKKRTKSKLRYLNGYLFLRQTVEGGKAPNMGNFWGKFSSSPFYPFLVLFDLFRLTGVKKRPYFTPRTSKIEIIRKFQKKCYPTFFLQGLVAQCASFKKKSFEKPTKENFLFSFKNS